MRDLIDRQAAIDYLLDKGMITSAIYLEQMPSVLTHTDYSSYSDKLWKTAYERGKAEAQTEIIRCKECLMHSVCRFELGLGLDGYCSQAKSRKEN